MKFIRKILVKILGLKGYLKFVSSIYIRIISMGLMKKKYAELFFLKKIIKPGNHVLDIGANLAYYSFFSARSAGKTGRIIGVEPIPIFADVWQKNMRKLKGYKFQLINCALGTEPKEKVKMSIPIVDGVVRHGLTKVVDDNATSNENSSLSFEVKMENGDELIEKINIEQLDFIKCDVEGFEQYVIPSLDKTIQKFHPVLQIELSGDENRRFVVDYLLKLSYEIYILNNHFLKPIQKNDIFSVNQDFYFIHQTKIDEHRGLIL